MRSVPQSVPAPGDNQPEAKLVALARIGNEAAIRKLIRRCNRQLFRVARGILHNDSEAEDVVQATYVSAFTKLEGFRGEAAFATWLTRIAMNEAYGRLRRQARIVDLTEYSKEADAGMTNTMRPPPTTPEAGNGENTETRRK